MIELPQPRRRSQPSLPSLPQQSSRAFPAESQRAAMGWSPADELAALETVWESLCQDAATSATSRHLPSFTSIPVARSSVQPPQRQQNRLAESPGRLAY